MIQQQDELLWTSSRNWLTLQKIFMSEQRISTYAVDAVVNVIGIGFLLLAVTAGEAEGNADCTGLIAAAKHPR